MCSINILCGLVVAYIVNGYEGNGSSGNFDFFFWVDGNFDMLMKL